MHTLSAIPIRVGPSSSALSATTNAQFAPIRAVLNEIEVLLERFQRGDRTHVPQSIESLRQRCALLDALAASTHQSCST